MDDLRKREVYERLCMVLDPELDQPVTELGFIKDVGVDENIVTVTFRLPTYWCAPNFAFLMASDIKQRVSELPWVREVRVILVDHCESDAINTGIAHGKSFTETFPVLATDDLEQLRIHFRRKAFVARQEKLYRHLKAAGRSDDSLARMTVADLQGLEDSDVTTATLVNRYLEVRGEILTSVRPFDAAFVDVTGKPLDATVLSVYMTEARKTRVAMEVNSVFCRGLLRTRYQDNDTNAEVLQR